MPNALHPVSPVTERTKMPMPEPVRHRNKGTQSDTGLRYPLPECRCTRGIGLDAHAQLCSKVELLYTSVQTTGCKNRYKSLRQKLDILFLAYYYLLFIYLNIKYKMQRNTASQQTVKISFCLKFFSFMTSGKYTVANIFEIQKWRQGDTERPGGN
jgi:hypothetical protein